MNSEYDIIVVGGGHAGCEAAHAAATMGANVLLISIDLTKLAQMSCNPAMGGIAKGQIIREIDALGGCSGIVTDRSMIQYRMLNKSIHYPQEVYEEYSLYKEEDSEIFNEELNHIENLL